MNPGVFFMMINSETIFSMTQANQNFSQVARSVDQNGKAVIFKNNKLLEWELELDEESLTAFMEKIIASIVLNGKLGVY